MTQVFKIKWEQHLNSSPLTSMTDDATGVVWNNCCAKIYKKIQTAMRLSSTPKLNCTQLALYNRYPIIGNEQYETTFYKRKYDSLGTLHFIIFKNSKTRIVYMMEDDWVSIEHLSNQLTTEPRYLIQNFIRDLQGCPIIKFIQQEQQKFLNLI